MKQVIYIGLMALPISSSDGPKSKMISIGEYTFDFPEDFKLIEEQGIESYVGQIKVLPLILK